MTSLGTERWGIRERQSTTLLFKVNVKLNRDTVSTIGLKKGD